MLKTENYEYYQVKQGQTLSGIAEYFSTSEYLLVKENGLIAPPYAGQILVIPKQRGNGYLVREGDTKELLCGGVEKFKEKNGTDAFYIGMKIII